jgi:Zn-dependent protease/CBS domain-containing protein
MLTIGRVRGIPIYVARSWIVVAVVYTLIIAPLARDWVRGLSDVGSYVVGALFAVLVYVGVLIHEFGHAFVAQRLGMGVRGITLHGMGGVTEIEDEGHGPRDEFLVSVIGPVLSLALGGISVALVQVFEPGSVVRFLCVELALANLSVGVLNLLPGLPLDGGRVVRAAVWGASGSQRNGTITAAWIGRGLAVAIVLLAVIVGPARGGDSNLFLVVWSVLIASVVWGGATQALNGEKIRVKLPRLSPRALARRAVPVFADVSVGEALRQASEAGARAIVVVDRDERPLAIVNEASVAALPVARRPWVVVADVARRITPELTVSVDASGEDVATLLSTNPATEYLVVDAAGLVYGVLSAADAEASFAAV